jgi:hypothetical protein
LRLYFDAAYLGKCYWNEPGGMRVRELARRADGLYSSAICIAEMACLVHRKVREAAIRSGRRHDTARLVSGRFE